MKKKNLAAILNKQRKNLILLNLEYPNVPTNYVLVKMKFSGICHTQLNEISGILGKDRFIPPIIEQFLEDNDIPFERVDAYYEDGARIDNRRTANLRENVVKLMTSDSFCSLNSIALPNL
mgnify:CR=1 FL=1